MDVHNQKYKLSSTIYGSNLHLNFENITSNAGKNNKTLDNHSQSLQSVFY